MRSKRFFSIFLIVFLFLTIIPLYKAEAQTSYLKTFEQYDTTLKIPEINIADSVISYQDTKELYQFNITLSKPPISNVIILPIETSGLDFIYQPPLNEELDAKQYDFLNATHALIKEDVAVYRPENVAGSYAVYMTQRKSGMTGKLYHIYRPLLVDAKGLQSWANLTVTKNSMSIVCDSEFLAKAAYPLVIDPSFGKTDVGGSQYTYWGYGGRDEVVACLFNLPEDGDVESVTMYLRTYNQPEHADGLMYAVYDDDSGSPDNLLGETEIGNIPAYGAPAWVTLDFSSALELSSADLWLAAMEDDERCIYYYDSGDADQTKGDYNGVDFDSGFNNPFGSSDYSEAYEVSIYANYTTGGAPSHTDAELSETINVSASLETLKTIYRSGTETTSVTVTQETEKDIIVRMTVTAYATPSISAVLYVVRDIGVDLIEVLSQTINISAVLYTSLIEVLTIDAVFAIVFLFAIIALVIAVVALALHYREE